MTDILKAIIALILLAATAPASAGQWFPEAAVYLDVTRDSSDIYCHRSNGHASHMGARVDLYTEGRHTIRALYVHNSCVEETPDRRNRDTLGIGYEYRLW